MAGLEFGQRGADIYLGAQMADVLEQRLVGIPLAEQLTRKRELARDPAFQLFIREDQEKIVENDKVVHIRHAINPSDGGKTFLLDTVGGINEQDKIARKRLQEASGNSQKRILPIKISLGASLVAEAKRLNKKKSELTPRERQYAVQRHTEALLVLTRVFRDHPLYTVEALNDSVGVLADEDLGESTIQFFLDNPNQEIWVPRITKDGEKRGRTARNIARLNALKSESGETNTDEELEKVGILEAEINGRESEFVNSCGTEEAWENHWRDIYRQWRFNPKYQFYWRNLGEPEIDIFLSDEFTDDRIEAYYKWLPERFEAMGISKDLQASKVRYVPGEFIVDGVHIDFERQITHQFPFEVLFNKPLMEVTAKEVLQKMKLKYK